MRAAGKLLTMGMLALAGAATGEVGQGKVWDPVAARKIAVEAVVDCAEGRVAKCREGFRRALELQPHHSEYLQLLAGAEERLGHPQAALEALALLHRQGFELAFEPPDEWVAKVVARPDYQRLYQETAPLRAPVARSKVAFRLPYREMLPEGLAYDAKTGDFFVSGVRERRIVRRSAKGEISDFVPPGSGFLWSALGMEADPAGRRLWVATTAYPPMVGYQPPLEGSAALLAFDLDSGKLLARFTSSRPGKKGFNDVCIAPDGAVFVTDHEERPGTLYRLAPGADLASRKLEPFGDPDALGSPEGMALSPDGRYLFVADYSYGIVRYELATGKHLHLPDAPEATLIGIDHLEYRDGGLIAVQNGGEPYSVLRLELSPEQDRVLSRQVLEREHPAFSDPTLGVMVGDVFYYVANSQWGKLDDDDKFPPASQLAEPIILALPLSQGKKSL